MENKTYILIGAGAAAVVIAAILLKQAGGAVADAAQAVNPLNNDNIINRGFTSLYQTITGSDETLGADIYDVTHDGTLNPASENNIVNRGVNWLGGTVADDPNWTLGGQIYDWTH